MALDWEVMATGYQLAEAPAIDRDGTLLFSDVLGGGVNRLRADGTVDTVVPKRRGVGGLVVHDDGGIVISGRDVVYVRDGESRTVLHADGVAGWNDICTDSAGRVYAGALRFAVFDPEATVVPGELWCIDPDAGPTVVFDDVVHANGVALSPDERTIFMSDTRARRLIVFDVDTRTRRDVDVSAHGHPDGMAVDESGAVWLALVSGGIGRFRPDGTLDQRFNVPSNFVTSCCFDGTALYVTTGTATHSVLRTDVGIPGAPVTPARC